jgi:4-hydroxybenzoate polyprenyltransferase
MYSFRLQDVPQTAFRSLGTDRQQQQGKQHSPDPSTTWVDQYVSTSLQPYARLARMDKPIGTWLLLWPCFWSTAVAAQPGCFPDPMLLGLFSVGAFVMRGAGCTINDYWDREIDAKVARTGSRPLANGDLTPNQAVGLLALQLTTGLAVLVSLPHTWYCFQWGAASLPLVATYPLMKRFFPYPQLILGFTFSKFSVRF